MDSVALVAGVTQLLPVGVVSPNESADPTAILQSAVPATGNLYVTMGADLYASYQLSKQFTVLGSYSYLSKPLTSYVGQFQNYYPYHKTNLALRFNDPPSGIFAEVRHRWTDAYSSSDVPPFFTSVPAASLVDLTFGYTIPSYSKLRLTLSVSNLLDHRYQSIAGTPAVGRLTTLQAHYTL